MYTLVVTRLLGKGLQTLLVLFLSLTAVFFLSRLAGDPAVLFLPMDFPAEHVAAMRREMGWDDPVLWQYARFLGKAVRGDFGASLRFHDDAMDLVIGRLPATLKLGTVSFLFTLFCAIPLGAMAAARHRTWFDSFVSGVFSFSQAVPGFWLGLVLIYLFSVQLGWLPTSGNEGALHLVMPSFVLASFFAPRIAHVTRNSLLGVLGEDYIRTARAKGLVERRVLWRHALKNASLPIVTLSALEFAQLLGGAVVTETVFAWPGLGRLIVQSMLHRDFPVVLAGVFFVSVTYTTMNFLVDGLYTWLDPRVRWAGK